MDDPEKTAAGVAKDATTGSALVQDYVVRRHVLEALAAGVPKLEVQKWVVDCSRNFFVRDDATFESAWFDLRSGWEANQRRKKRRIAANLSAQTTDTRSDTRQKHLPKKLAGSVGACVSAAKHDVRLGLCCCYEQALAVHLVLAFGSDAANVWSETSTITTESAGKHLQEDAGSADSLRLKKLLLLVHPDKNIHPRATQAFQKLAPSLRTSASDERERSSGSL
mmetsp:Transcript_69829/g.138170  ORF Transcript_69829/g.138170 Transcript_69829/m.138170 type:complete len:223 (-) Transcript_69829:52-720(-)